MNKIISKIPMALVIFISGLVLVSQTAEAEGNEDEWVMYEWVEWTAGQTAEEGIPSHMKQVPFKAIPRLVINNCSKCVTEGGGGCNTWATEANVGGVQTVDMPDGGVAIFRNGRNHDEIVWDAMKNEIEKDPRWSADWGVCFFYKPWPGVMVDSSLDDLLRNKLGDGTAWVSKSEFDQ